jgi:hypothetical protein
MRRALPPMDLGPPSAQIQPRSRFGSMAVVRFTCRTGQYQTPLLQRIPKLTDMPLAGTSFTRLVAYRVTSKP